MTPQDLFNKGSTNSPWDNFNAATSTNLPSGGSIGDMGAITYQPVTNMTLDANMSTPGGPGVKIGDTTYYNPGMTVDPGDAYNPNAPKGDKPEDTGPSPWDQFQDNFGSGFSELSGNLNSRIDQLSGLSNTLTGNLGDALSGTISNIDLAKQGALDQFGQQIDQTKQNTKMTLRDLATDFENALSAGANRLGIMGAGDSSAANMLNFALSKATNRRNTDVVNQERGILADIEMGKQNVIRAAEEQINNANIWYAQEKNKIAQYIQGLRDNLENAIQNLNEVDKQNEYNRMINEYQAVKQHERDIDSIWQQSNAQVASWAQNQAAMIEAFGQQKQANEYTGSVDPQVQRMNQNPFGSNVARNAYNMTVGGGNWFGNTSDEDNRFIGR